MSLRLNWNLREMKSSFDSSNRIYGKRQKNALPMAIKRSSAFLKRRLESELNFKGLSNARDFLVHRDYARQTNARKMAIPSILPFLSSRNRALGGRLPLGGQNGENQGRENSRFRRASTLRQQGGRSRWKDLGHSRKSREINRRFRLPNRRTRACNECLPCNPKPATFPKNPRSQTFGRLRRRATLFLRDGLNKIMICRAGA